MQVHDGAGRNITPRIRKSRAVLAVLALAAPRPVLRDDLAAMLWSRRDRDQARASLRQCIHELQALLAPLDPGLLNAERTHLSLATAGVRTDLRTGSTPGAPLLTDLVGLDPAFDRWLETERRRLGRVASAIAEAELFEHTQVNADPAAAIVAAEHLLAIDPRHQGGWRALITAHDARGDRPAAIAAYHRCITALAENSDTVPSPETQAVFTGLHAAGAPHALATPGARAIAPPPHPISSPPAAPRRRGIRIGVRPFRTLGGTDLTDPLSLGLAEEITAALSRFKWVFLIASPSLAAIASEPGADDPQWRELALDFVLDGTVQRSDDRVRVLVRLLDIKSGPDSKSGPEIVWVGRFDRIGVDILTLQDEIAAETVARIDPELIIREGRRAAGQTASSTTAYDLVLAAIPAIYRLEETSFRTAGTALAEAVRLDPDYAAAHAWLACWHVFLVGQNWAEDPAIMMSYAATLAERAIALDPTDARGITIAGHVRAFLYHRVDEAIALHDRALSLNPNMPLAWAFSGLALAYSGRHAEALSRLHRARQLSPFDPHSFFFDMGLMLAHFLRGEHVIVIELARRSLAQNPGFTSTYKIALAALGHLGRTDEAREMSAQLLAREPHFTVTTSVARTPMQVPADLALYAEGLRRAGLPL